MPPSWHTLEYRLHARVGILHGRKPAVQLWYALRALDVDGSGKVTIPVGEAERQLGKSASTIRRYLMDDVLFRSYSVTDGVITIYLHGLASVCRALYLTDIGPVGFNEGLGQLVKDSALVGAVALQQASLYLATHDKQGHCIDAVDVVDATKITTVQELMGTTSYITGGVTAATTLAEDVLVDVPQLKGTFTINTITGRPQPVHMLRLGTHMYGASLAGIAGLLQVCSKTISRALQGTLRIRQAQQIYWSEYYHLKNEASETLTGTNSEDCKYPFYSKHEHMGPYRLYTYLYYPLYQLCSQRVLKSHVNPWLKGCGAWAAG